MNIYTYFDNYQEIYSDWIGQDITNFEIDLIKSLVDKNDFILDIGAGTGRHLKYLKGYNITALEVNEDCVNYLKYNKLAKNFIHININDYSQHPENKYKLAYMLFNTFCETCLTYHDGALLIDNIFKNTLVSNGHLLLCITDTDDLIPHTGDNFKVSKKNNELNYHISYLVNDISDTVVKTEDSVVIANDNNILYKETWINRKKWWKSSELISIAKELSLVLSITQFDDNTYYLISK